MNSNRPYATWRLPCRSVGIGLLCFLTLFILPPFQTALATAWVDLRSPCDEADAEGEQPSEAQALVDSLIRRQRATRSDHSPRPILSPPVSFPDQPLACQNLSRALPTRGREGAGVRFRS